MARFNSRSNSPKNMPPLSISPVWEESRRASRKSHKRSRSNNAHFCKAAILSCGEHSAAAAAATAGFPQRSITVRLRNASQQLVRVWFCRAYTENRQQKQQHQAASQSRSRPSSSSSVVAFRDAAADSATATVSSNSSWWACVILYTFGACEHLCACVHRKAPLPLPPLWPTTWAISRCVRLRRQYCMLLHYHQRFSRAARFSWRRRRHRSRCHHLPQQIILY